MKSLEEIRKARDVVCFCLADPKLTIVQKTLLSGLSVALQWVCEEGGHTLQQLIDGRPIGHERN